MKRLYLTLASIAVMAFLIPMAPWLAVSQQSPAYTHFVYMFGHANILHWLINAWALITVHNLLRPHRVITAYTLSVLITILPSHFTLHLSPFTLHPSPFTLHPSPLIGSSVITVFFFGFYAPCLFRKDRLASFMMLAILLIGFFIPGIAALPHLVMFILGLICFFLEREYLRFHQFINQPHSPHHPHHPHHPH